MEPERLRLLDFYLLFPSAVVEMRLPRGATAWRKRFRGLSNPYVFPEGSSRSVFRQVRPIHEHGVALLAAKGLLDPDAFQEGRIESSFRSLPAGLAELVHSLTEPDAMVLRFFREVADQLALVGRDGLKDRSGLMEFRYDTT